MTLPQRTAIANAFSSSPPEAVLCDACTGSGIIRETPRDCRCLCHGTAAHVVIALEKRAISPRAAARMLIAVMGKQSHCRECREIHACTICGGKGAL